MGLNAGAVLRSGAGPGLQRLLALGAAEMAERVWIAQLLGLLWALVPVSYTHLDSPDALLNALSRTQCHLKVIHL